MGYHCRCIFLTDITTVHLDFLRIFSFIFFIHIYTYKNEYAKTSCFTSMDVVIESFYCSKIILVIKEFLITFLLHTKQIFIYLVKTEVLVSEILN